ncbi:MAG: ABC transporter substrate-binding protein [bacterium]|nr:ABC transporter substrate-binding protein [bacterium]
MKKRRALVLALAGVLCLSTACGKTKTDSLDWWDHFANLEETHQALYDAYEQETGIHVNYENFDAASFKEAFDLALTSHQAPDILSYAWDQNNAVAKYQEGSFSALTVKKEDLPEYVQNTLVEGYTMFDGKVYSFPTFNINHQALLWYNTEMVDQVPESLADFRQQLKDLTNVDANQYGIALPLTDTGRMHNLIRYITALSGGTVDFDYTTGQYVYDSDLLKEVFQFFVDIYEDGSVHPASTTLKTRTVRERWVNNEAAYAIDGCWYPGSINSAFGAESLDKLGVSAMPVVDPNVRGVYGTAPQTGTFYVTGDCEDTEAATELMLKLLDDDYAIALASAMDQPPLNTAAIEKADVAPVYVEGCNIMASQVSYYPEPQVRNPNVAEVYTELIEIKPNIGDIYVGYVTGTVSDWKAALDEYNRLMNEELDRAIKACQDRGVEVSRDDWIFPNFVLGESYTSDKYAELK